MGSCSKWVKTQPVESRSPASRSAATTSLSLLSKKIQLGGTTCSCWWDPETKQPAVCKEVITRNLKKRCFFCWVLKGKNQHVHFFFCDPQLSSSNTPTFCMRHLALSGPFLLLTKAEEKPKRRGYQYLEDHPI